MTKKQELQNAIEAGYWVARDHGWLVGCGTEILLGGQRFEKKEKLRKL